MPRQSPLRTLIISVIAAIWCAAMLAYTFAQEPAVGSVQGRVVGVDTGRPIGNAQVYIWQDAGPYGERTNRSTRTKRDGTFRMSDLPAGNYSMNVQARAHSLSNPAVSVREGRTENFNLELTPAAPSLQLYIHQELYTSKEKPELVLDGFTKGDEIAVTLFRVDIDKVLFGKAPDIQTLLTRSWNRPTFNRRDLAANQSIRRSSVTHALVSNRDNEGMYHQKLSLGVQPQGVYVVLVSVDDIDRVGWISVSDVSLITKESGGEVLAYTVHPNTGAPVQDAQVQIFEGKDIVATGKTSLEGIWRGRAKSTRAGERNRFVVARKGGSTSFLTTYAYTPHSSSISIYAYTDRPVYRPGHRVRFRGLVRKLVGDNYLTPVSGDTDVQVRDRRGTMIYHQSLKLSRFGSFHGEFDLPEFAATGNYDVTCTYAGRAQAAAFSVAEYRKPEFSVDVTMPAKRCMRGETVKATIRANYYFGAPVVGAKVTYSISRADYWSYEGEGDSEYYGGYEYEGDDYEGDYGDLVAEGEIVTGPDGTAQVEFVAGWPEPKGESSDVDQSFTLTASISDQSGKSADGEGSIVATRGQFRLNIEATEYITSPGKPARFVVSARDYDGKPQRDVSVELTASKVGWEEDEEKYEQVASAVVRTDEAGKAKFVFTPAEQGSYVVRGVARDRKGNVIKSSAWEWVSGEGDIQGYKYPDLQVVLDKKSYNLGDTAKVLINSSEKGATALLTIEGRRLFDYKLVYLKNKSTMVEIPIKPGYRPNFFVKVCYVKGKHFQNQQAQARVSLKERTINLSVVPNKTKYEPGEFATYTIRTLDDKGRPVSAEVSLGVVDEAIYAIQEDDTTPVRDFFYHRQENTVTTHTSFTDVYLSGDKAGYTGVVRKDFKDTAFWRANVVTDKAGQARVRFKLPDNLTTWRATARACDANTRVGQTVTKIVCTKKLLVRLETPRFLVQTDETVISAIVHNYLPKDVTVKVGIQAPGLSVQDDVVRTVTVVSNGVQRVDWRVTAPNHGRMSVMAYASSPDAEDAMKITLPVRPNGQRDVFTQTGIVTQGSVSEKVTVRGDAVPGASEIRIRLAPSIAAAMLGSLEYLAEYPYGCTEQTMSCFLPDVFIWQTMKQLKLENAWLKEELPNMVGRGLNRLYDFQNESGGWGWCEYGSGDLWMTSYVTFGLLTAKQAGFEVNKEVLDNALSAVERTLGEGKHRPSDRVYAVYVLSLGGRTDTVRRMLNDDLLSRIANPNELALVALTFANIGDNRKSQEYLGRLWKRAVVTPEEIHWGQPNDWHEQPTEVTGLALLAAVKLNPDDVRIPRVINWLLRRRQANHWYSTKDTAQILYALSEYLPHTGELQPNFTATVTQNGRVLANLRFDKSSVFSPEKDIVIRSKEVKGGSNSLGIRLAGSGRLYYTVELAQYVRRRADVRTVNESGITITREYHKLVPKWHGTKSGSRLEPSDARSTDFQVGDTVRVKLIVRSPRQYQRLLIEDYLPAGCEAFDRGRMERWEWNYWWVERDVRDERVSFYVDTLRNGESVLEYEFRASTPGAYRAMPPLVQAMYNPSIGASGVTDVVRVR